MAGTVLKSDFTSHQGQINSMLYNLLRELMEVTQLILHSYYVHSTQIRYGFFKKIKTGPFSLININAKAMNTILSNQIYQGGQNYKTNRKLSYWI